MLLLTFTTKNLLGYSIYDVACITLQSVSCMFLCVAPLRFCLTFLSRSSSNSVYRPGCKYIFTSHLEGVRITRWSCALRGRHSCGGFRGAEATESRAEEKGTRMNW